MPMPNQKFLNELLDYYYTVKATKSAETLYGMGLSLLQKAHIVDNLAEKRVPINEDLKSRIESAKTAEVWIGIALSCGSEARKAQALAKWGCDCDYAKVMHACRSYIIDMLTRDQKNNDILNQAIQSRITELAPLEAAYFQEAQKNYLPENQRKSYYDKLIELSDLGHVLSCVKAATYRDCIDLELYTKDNFAKLPYKKRLCPSIPKCYQSTYYVVYYLEEGMKAGTRKNTTNNTEMYLSTYIKWLNNNKAAIPDVISAELSQDDDIDERDFLDEGDVMRSVTPTARRPFTQTEQNRGPRSAHGNPSSSPRTLFQPGYRDDGSMYPPRPPLEAPLEMEERVEELPSPSPYQ